MEGMDTYIVANDGIVILRALLSTRSVSERR
jgi:hypothetical protein